MRLARARNCGLRSWESMYAMQGTCEGDNFAGFPSRDRSRQSDPRNGKADIEEGDEKRAQRLVRYCVTAIAGILMH